VIRLRSIAFCAVAALVGMAGVGCDSEKQAASPTTVDEVLALMNGTGRSHQTITARVSYWSDDTLVERALDKRFGEARAGAVIFRSATSLRVWLERPNRCRSEGSGETAVADGHRAWREFRGTKNVMLQEQASAGFNGCGGDMFAEPASVLEGLTLSLEGEENVGSRRVAALRGDPKLSSDNSSGGSRAGLGDRHRILIDLETGLPVSVESSFEGKPLDRTTVDELAVDVSIPDGTFAYTPAPDARVLDEEDLKPLDLPIAEAAARVSFPVWAPSGFKGNVSIFPDLTTDSGIIAIPVGGTGASPVSVTETSATVLDGEGRRIVRQGMDVLIIEENQASSAVALLRNGTRIEIRGPGTPEEVADVALSFQRVAKQ
jgi:outer membrane lipoprotein-sorting protein